MAVGGKPGLGDAGVVAVAGIAAAYAPNYAFMACVFILAIVSMCVMHEWLCRVFVSGYMRACVWGQGCTGLCLCL